MVQEGFNKFFWGFLFIMLDFRIQGFDILPDVIGFILFAMGFHVLAEYSEFFVKGKTFNLFAIFISLFTIYERPNQDGGVHFNLLGMIVGMISLVLLLIVVYNIFMGIKDMASKLHRFDIAEEAEKKWKYFFVFQIAGLFLFVLLLVPSLFIVFTFAMFIAAIVLMVIIMRFMKTCGEQL